MLYKQTTQVPNCIFDHYLSSLSKAELKLVLVITRQTLGWFDKRTGMRKNRDRISISQFYKKTSLSRRAITLALQSLVQKSLITITDYRNNEMLHPSNRKGKAYLYYSLKIPTQILSISSKENRPGLATISALNKTNYTNQSTAKTKSMQDFNVGSILAKRGI